jgi:hypothetical protein
MALQIQRMQIWAGEIANRDGVAAGMLEHLARAGTRLEFVCTYPHLSNPERGVLYLAPITGAEQMQAARDVGLGPALDLVLLHVRGEAGRDLGRELMSRLAVAGIYLRGMAVNTSPEGFDAYLALDNADIAALAVQVLATLEQ